MSIDITLPELGENVEEGDVVNVLVREGDTIAAGQPLLEIETGKAVVELPSSHAGRVSKLYVGKGAKVRVGERLLAIAADGAQAEPSTSARPTVAAAPSPAPPSPRLAPVVAAGAAVATRTAPAGPATRRLARELGVDLTTVDGTGPGGRITEDDVKAAVRRSAGGREAVAERSTSGQPIAVGRTGDTIAGFTGAGGVRREKMSGVRKAIAANMQLSAAIPQVTNFDDADITELERIRKGGLVEYADSSIKLTMLAFVVKAAAQSLRMHPLVNASIDVEREEIIYHDYVHVGVAVDTERGLVVPVLRDVDRMSIPRIAQAISTVAEQARAKRLSLDDLRGSTFTISNLGAVGGTYSTPLVNPPNVAILLTGRSRRLPVVTEGDRVEPRLLMPLSLSYDHRIVDGATAGRFLNELIGYLAVPGRLLLAP